MEPQDAVHAVFASPHPLQWYETLDDLLQKGHEEACAEPTPLARMEAHRRHFLWYDDVCSALTTEAAQEKLLAAGLRSYGTRAAMPAMGDPKFMALLRHHAGLVKQGFGNNRALRTRIRNEYGDRVARQDLGDALCGTYPFRHADLGPVRVRSAPALSRPSRAGNQYPYASLAPFVCEDLSETERAALHHARLRVHTLTASDLQSPDERGLIGQRGVFAKVAIPAGECLGVYGGQILDPVDSFLLDDYRYVYKASDEPGRLLVNGETMMSLVNSRYVFDARGRIIGHPSGGYNVEEGAFLVGMSDGRDMLVHGYFALTPIEPGQELRICYHLSKLEGGSGFSATASTHAACA